MARLGFPLVLSAIVAASARNLQHGRAAAPSDCYMVEDPPTESKGAKGRSYRGMVSSTVSGRTCQKWTATHPWKEAADFSPSKDEKGKDMMTWGNGIGNHNFCRNPDSSMDQPWCFTQDPNKEHKKELCEIPKCPKNKRDFSDEAQNLAMKIGSRDCECGDQLYGSSKTTANTVVQLQEGKNLRRPCTCK